MLSHDVMLTHFDGFTLPHFSDNRDEWEQKGEQVVAELVKKYQTTSSKEDEDKETIVFDVWDRGTQKTNKNTPKQKKNENESPLHFIKTVSS